MGTLSGVLTIFRKCSSVRPTPKKARTSAVSEKATFGEVMTRGKDTNSTNTTVAKVKMVTGDETGLTNCLTASNIRGYRGPLMPPSFRILQKWTDMSTTTTVGIATQC